MITGTEPNIKTAGRYGDITTQKVKMRSDRPSFARGPSACPGLRFVVPGEDDRRCTGRHYHARVLKAVDSSRCGWESAELICYSEIMHYNHIQVELPERWQQRILRTGFAFSVTAMVSIIDVLSSACFPLPHAVAGDYVSGWPSPLCCSRKRFRVVLSPAARPI